MYSWCPKLMPVICLPFWWVFMIIGSLLGLVFHNSIVKHHFLSRFVPAKRPVAVSDK